jgi:hypothetical protein
MKWVREFLARPHPQLGRSGTVCPWVPRAIELDTIFPVIVKSETKRVDAVEAAVRKYRDLFLQQEPREGAAATFKTIILVFPGIDNEEAASLIDPVQRALKPFFTAAGLMLGEFHPRSMTRGLHSADMFPLRSPFPMLAIRFMVESDIVFLMRDVDPPAARCKFLSSYLNRLTGKLSDSNLRIAREALTAAELELKSGSGTNKCPIHSSTTFSGVTFRN